SRTPSTRTTGRAAARAFLECRGPASAATRRVVPEARKERVCGAFEARNLRALCRSVRVARATEASRKDAQQRLRPLGGDRREADCLPGGLPCAPAGFTGARQPGER